MTTKAKDQEMASPNPTQSTHCTDASGLSEQDDIGASPTSLTGTDAMWTEMPLEDEEDEEEIVLQARREVRAAAREQAAKLPAKLVSTQGNKHSSSVDSKAPHAWSSVQQVRMNRIRRREQEIADEQAEESAELSAMLQGQWEICVSQKDDSRRRQIWGQATVRSLHDASLMRHRSDKEFPCHFEGTFDSGINVRWQKHYATLDLPLSNFEKGKLKWRLPPLPDGRLGGYTTWRKKQGDDQPLVFPKNDPSQCSVIEVVSEEEKRQQVFKLHSQKDAFQHDHEHLRGRVFENENGKIRCRSWLLATEHDFGEVFVAAVTVRINPYKCKDEFAWAQIMNLSVLHERSGYGTCLMAGVEELLWRERVDICTLYPVPNNRADRFWMSLGYGRREESLLPAEELDQRSGALVVEGYMEKGVRKVLPRWEKKLMRDYELPELPANPPKRRRISTADGSKHDIDSHDSATWKALKRCHWPLWRKLAPEDCKLDAEELSQAFAIFEKERQHRKTKERERAFNTETQPCKYKTHK